MKSALMRRVIGMSAAAAALALGAAAPASATHDEYPWDYSPFDVELEIDHVLPIGEDIQVSGQCVATDHASVLVELHNAAGDLFSVATFDLAADESFSGTMPVNVDPTLGDAALPAHGDVGYVLTRCLQYDGSYESSDYLPNGYPAENEFSLVAFTDGSTDVSKPTQFEATFSIPSVFELGSTISVSGVCPSYADAAVVQIGDRVGGWRMDRFPITSADGSFTQAIPVVANSRGASEAAPTRDGKGWAAMGCYVNGAHHDVGSDGAEVAWTAPVGDSTNEDEQGDDSDSTPNTTPTESSPEGDVSVSTDEDGTVTASVTTGTDESAASADALAYTGSNTAPIALGGITLLALGAGAVWLSRRKKHAVQ